MNLYVSQPGFFREREIELLEEVAMDISFALDKIDGDARRQQTEVALHESEAQFRLLFESTRDALMLMAPPTFKFTRA